MTTREQKLDYSCCSMNNEQSEHQEQEQQYKQHSNNNYYYYMAPGAGRALLATAEEFAQIREAYTDNIGPMTGAAAKLIEEALAEKIPPEDVVRAIEITGLAPRPSAYYLQAILDDWIVDGVHYSRSRMKPGAGAWWK